MSVSPRVAVVGAASLKGKELGSALKDREFPSRSTRLLDDAAETGPTEHRFTEFGDEAALLDPPSEESLAGADIIFFTGDSSQTERFWTAARKTGALLIDLTGYAEGESGSQLFGPDPEIQLRALPSVPRIAALPHPAALLLVHLLTAASRAGRIGAATAQIFEPVSERGLAGIQELQQQTLNLLTFQPAPTSIYGGQIAFNLKAELGDEIHPGIGEINTRIASQVRQLLAQAGPGVTAPAMRLLQAPIFHAHVVSLFLQFAEPTSAAALTQALGESPALHLHTADQGQPDVLDAAGEDLFQIGAPQADASIANGFWLFASFDNLRVAALHAVDVAAALVRRQEPVA